MFTRLSRTGGRTYLQIVEAYRTDTGSTRQRLVASLGRLDQLKPKHLDPLINGLNRALGRTAQPAEPIRYESALAYGHTHALNQLWSDLGLATAVRRALGPARRPGRPVALAVAGDADNEFGGDDDRDDTDSADGVGGDAATAAIVAGQASVGGRLAVVSESAISHGADSSADADIEGIVRSLVFHRLCDPLGDDDVRRWRSRVVIPGLTATLSGERIEAAIEALAVNADAVQEQLIRPIGSLGEQRLGRMICDLISIRAGSAGLVPGTTKLERNPGDPADEQRFVLAVVSSDDGLPLAHAIMAGDEPDQAALRELLQSVAVPRAIQQLAYRVDRRLADAGTLELLANVAASVPLTCETITSVPSRCQVDGLALRGNFADGGGAIGWSEVKAIGAMETADPVEAAGGDGKLVSTCRDWVRADALIGFMALVLRRVIQSRLNASGSDRTSASVLRELAQVQQHRVAIGEFRYSGISQMGAEQEKLFESIGVGLPITA